MRFVTFLENRFQEIQDQQQSEIAHNAKLDAKLKALHAILTGYRTALKWKNVPVMLFEYWEVCQGLRPVPVPILVNKLKKKQEEDKLKKDVEAGTHLQSVGEPEASS